MSFNIPLDIWIKPQSSVLVFGLCFVLTRNPPSPFDPHCLLPSTLKETSFVEPDPKLVTGLKRSLCSFWLGSPSNQPLFQSFVDNIDFFFLPRALHSMNPSGKMPSNRHAKSRARSSPGKRYLPSCGLDLRATGRPHAQAIQLRNGIFPTSHEIPGGAAAWWAHSQSGSW